MPTTLSTDTNFYTPRDASFAANVIGEGGSPHFTIVGSNAYLVASGQYSFDTKIYRFNPDTVVTASTAASATFSSASQVLGSRSYFLSATEAYTLSQCADGLIRLYRYNPSTVAGSTAPTATFSSTTYVSDLAWSFLYNGTNSIIVFPSSNSVIKFWRFDPATVASTAIAETGTFQSVSQTNQVLLSVSGSEAVFVLRDNTSNIKLWRFDPSTVTGTAIAPTATFTAPTTLTAITARIIGANSYILGADQYTGSVKFFRFNSSTITGTGITFTASLNGAAPYSLISGTSGGGEDYCFAQAFPTAQLYFWRFNPTTLSGSISNHAIFTLPSTVTVQPKFFYNGSSSYLFSPNTLSPRMSVHQFNPASVTGTQAESGYFSADAIISPIEYFYNSNFYLAAYCPSISSIQFYRNNLNKRSLDYFIAGKLTFDSASLIRKISGGSLTIYGAIDATTAFLFLRSGTAITSSSGIDNLAFSYAFAASSDAVGTLAENFIYSGATATISGNYRITMGASTTLTLGTKGTYTDSFTLPSTGTLAITANTVITSEMVLVAGTTVSGAFSLTIPYANPGLVLSGGATLIAPTQTLTLTNLQTGSIVYLLNANHQSLESGTASGASYTFSTAIANGTSYYYGVMKPGFLPLESLVVGSTANQSVPAVQATDNFYNSAFTALTGVTITENVTPVNYGGKSFGITIDGGGNPAIQLYSFLSFKFASTATYQGKAAYLWRRMLTTINALDFQTVRGDYYASNGTLTYKGVQIVNYNTSSPTTILNQMQADDASYLNFCKFVVTGLQSGSNVGLLSGSTVLQSAVASSSTLVFAPFFFSASAIYTINAGLYGYLRATANTSSDPGIVGVPILQSVDNFKVSSTPATITNWTYTTGLITQTATGSFQNLWDSHQYFYSLLANIGLTPQLSTIDGVTRNSAANYTLNSGVTLTGAGILALQANVLTLSSIGAYTFVAAIGSTGIVVVIAGATNLQGWTFISGAAINRVSGSATVTVDTAQAPNITAGTGVALLTPAVTFSAPSINNGGFNNVRCRTSLYLRSALTNANVNTTTNRLTIAGTTGKITQNTIVRLAGTDLPTPLEADRVYYPYAIFGTSFSLSGSTGGAGNEIDLTSIGSGGMIIILITELDIQLVTSGGYSFNLITAASTAAVTLASNDVLILQAVDWKGSLQAHTPVRASKYLEEFQVYTGSSVATLSQLKPYFEHNTFAIQQVTDGYQISLLTVAGSSPTRYQWRVDGSAPGRVQIESEDPDRIISTQYAVLFFQFLQWSASGMRLLRGQIEAENLNSIQIRSLEVGISTDLTIESFPVGQPLLVNGAGMYRTDGKTWIATGSPIQHQPDALVAVPIEVKTPINLSEAIVDLLHSMAAGVGYLTANGGSLTQQQIRDAQALALSSGATIAVTSIDSKLDNAGSDFVIL